MKELTLRELNRLEEKPMFSVRDPISALTHFIGFIAAIAVTPLLMSRVAITDGNGADLIGAAIYMLSMVLLYGASTSHHSFVLPSRPDRILKKLDHMSIFVLIAGTYTPICLSALPRETGIPLLMVSAGGSSTMSFMCCIGISQAVISAYRRGESRAS